MKALLPEGFDLTKHIAQYLPHMYGITKFKPDYALYILTQITLVPARNKSIADEMKDGLTPLSSRLLQKVVRDYNKYLSYFVKTGVIYTNKMFKPSSVESKGYSRGYRFTDTYKTTDVIVVDYTKEFVRHLRKKRKEDFAQLKEDYGHLTKWLWPDCRLRIDGQAAMDFLNVRRQAQQGNPALVEKKIHPVFGHEIPKDPEVQYKHAKANVDCLLSGDLGCTVDSKVGRMHTVLTNIKSDLRNLITFDGKLLVNIDIKNSQPYLSTLLFNPSFWDLQLAKNKIKINTINKEIYEEIKQITNTTLILVKLKQVLDNQDFVLYCELVGAKKSRNGPDLYTFMGDRSAKVMRVNFLDRAEVKKGMFEVLFSKNSNYGRTKVKRLFKELFPSINPLFELLKEGDHSRLSRLLQSIESYIVLKVITKSIHRMNKNIPLFTIHDSITTTAEHAETVRVIMEKELTRLVGLPPKLKVETWHPDSLSWVKYQNRSSAGESHFIDEQLAA
ncbi:hypothetical protein [Spirosoma radiotolerans]|uniref:Uncharacterized protein n=1 Tax=Spirosoma radiotolerans TaxID=1379870 RepID=A0A0E3ZXJ8_9BACT|nr:hypothetical protein [Spirosoma radiotolerans]AKD56969.1 hypothetical protein SD10_20750 [Spirosoma radiotolerans]